MNPNLAEPATAVHCPDRRRLERFSLGQLPAAEQESCASHLDQCASCRQYLAELDGLEDSLVRELRDTKGREPISEHLLRRLEEAGIATSLEPIPPSIGAYQLIRYLGKGAMGVVYEAEHVHLRRRVAIKLLSANRTQDAQALERFQREMQAVAQLDHPNIVRATDAGVSEDRPYLVLELLKGVDLARLVRTGGPVPVAEACELVRQAALGLAHAHAAPIVHRDIKPSNLMLQPDGVVKILDLGLARWLSAAPVEGDLTAVNQVVGTPDYLAPEQGLLPAPISGQADLYSLGCTLFFLLTGHPPFHHPECQSLMQKLSAHARDPLPSLTDFRPDAPPALAHLLSRLLAKDPTKRPAGAGETALALAAFCSGADLQALLVRREKEPSAYAANAGSTNSAVGREATHSEPAATVSRPRWRRTWAGVAGTALLATILLGGWFAWFPTLHAPHGEQAAPAAKVSDGRRALQAALETAELPGSVRRALKELLHKDSQTNRWSGVSEELLIAAGGRRLPPAGKQEARIVLARSEQMLVVGELLSAEALLRTYESDGLTDLPALRQAVLQSAKAIHSEGSIKGLQFQGFIQGDWAVAWAWASRAEVVARLRQPAMHQTVRRSYGNVLSQRAGEQMRNQQWQEALGVWRHLQQNKLASPDLYLGVARCFHGMKQDGDALKVLQGNFDNLAANASADWLERCGDLALELGPAAEPLARKAFETASLRLLNTQSESTPQPEANHPKPED